MSDTLSPASIEEFRTRLTQVSDGLPKRLRQCADFVARNPERIAVSTVAELAEAAGVQPSAFMRFCQIMGFSGFSQMQRLFRDSYAQRWPDYRTRLENLKSSGNGSPSALLAEFVEAGRLSLANLAHTVEAGALEKAVEVLAGARMIHLVGMKRAFPVASYLSYIFDNMDIPSFLHDRVGNLDHRHAILPGDALVAITFAPYTRETVELASFARDKGCALVALTDSLNSPLHRLGAAALMISEVDVGAFRALSATFSLTVALAVAVGTRRNSRRR